MLSFREKTINEATQFIRNSKKYGVTSSEQKVKEFGHVL